jgi:hypothetical protein
MPTLGKTLITLVAVATSTGCFMADWNETHIYNPAWPPHAKFHNGQTMSMGLLLGLATVWYLYAPVKLPIPTSGKVGAGERGNDGIWRAVQRDAELANLQTVGLLGALYWVTQASAYLYPGSGAFDSDPGVDGRDHWVQAKLDTVLLTMLSVGWWLERKRIRAA